VKIGLYGDCKELLQASFEFEANELQRMILRKFVNTEVLSLFSLVIPSFPDHHSKKKNPPKKFVVVVVVAVVVVVNGVVVNDGVVVNVVYFEEGV